jgi:hypothetical protein
MSGSYPTGGRFRTAIGSIRWHRSADSQFHTKNDSATTCLRSAPAIPPIHEPSFPTISLITLRKQRESGTTGTTTT